MSTTHHVHSLDHTMQTTNRWLAAVAGAIGTEDREFAHRVLRTWLHAVRDGLPVPAAAHLAAQLPDLLRGIYYNGWDPAAVPIRRDREEFTAHFAATGRVANADVPKLAKAVTSVMYEELTPGVVDHALGQLPREVRDLLGGPC